MARLILIVDDCPNAAGNLEIALQGLPGVETLTASTGAEALQLIEADSRPLAAVVTDLEMPRMDGFELIERLRADRRFKRLPIIVSSASTDPGTPDRVRRLGADAFFLKPYSLAELRNQLEQLLNAQQRQDHA
jgi:two-component system, chemotaxis family, chemotaxis protein CheY